MDKKKKVYLFRVSLDKKVYREMALKGTSNLYKFAETIINAFNFELDHSFGFYSNINDIYKSNEVYTLFYDTDSSLTVMPNERSVKNSYIYKVFEPDKKMIFLFDYGDNWEFLVECCGITEAETGTRPTKPAKIACLLWIVFLSAASLSKHTAKEVLSLAFLLRSSRLFCWFHM